MRQRHNGFINFMRKLEGNKHDNILQKEGLGFRVHSGYECLLELLRSDICFRTYLERLRQCSASERRETYNLRRRIGLDFPFDPLGVYVTDRSFYFKAVEYLREHQAGEQQETVSASTHGQLPFSDTDYVDISPCILDDF